MKVTRDNIKEYLYNNTCIEIIYEIHEARDEFDVIGECGGDVLHYRIKKEDGAIYCK